MHSPQPIPHAGTSGSGIGWGADLPAGGLQWLNHLSSCLGKVGLAPFVGGNLGSKVFSPALVVYADEVIGEAVRFAEGFPLDEEAAALEEIAAQGPGGSFMLTDLTLKLFRQAYHQSAVFPRLTMEQWEEQGHPRAENKLKKYTHDLLESLAAPEDRDELIGRGEAFIGRRAG